MKTLIFSLVATNPHNSPIIIFENIREFRGIVEQRERERASIFIGKQNRKSDACSGFWQAICDADYVI